MIARDVSSALVALIGKGRSAVPGESWAMVTNLPASVETQLVEIIADYRRLSQIDWQSVDDDLARGMELFRETFRRFHPELDGAALDALEWKFSWDWR